MADPDSSSRQLAPILTIIMPLLAALLAIITPFFATVFATVLARLSALFPAFLPITWVRAGGGGEYGHEREREREQDRGHMLLVHDVAPCRKLPCPPIDAQKFLRTMKLRSHQIDVTLLSRWNL